VFTVVADTAPAATREDVFALPAQAADVLRSIGALALAPDVAAASGKVVAVLGACGGAGASVLSAALCRAAGNATLVDAHQLSGGLDLLLGLEARPARAGAKSTSPPAGRSRARSCAARCPPARTAPRC